MSRTSLLLWYWPKCVCGTNIKSCQVTRKAVLFLCWHQNIFNDTSPTHNSDSVSEITLKTKVEATFSLVQKMTIKQMEFPIPIWAWEQFKSNSFQYNKAKYRNTNAMLKNIYNNSFNKEHTLNHSFFWVQSIIPPAFHIPTSKILTPINRKQFQYWSLFPALSHNSTLYESSVFQRLCNHGTVRSSPQSYYTNDSIISKTCLPAGDSSQRVRTETFLCIWHWFFKSQIFSSI